MARTTRETEGVNHGTGETGVPAPEPCREPSWEPSREPSSAPDPPPDAGANRAVGPTLDDARRRVAQALAALELQAASSASLSLACAAEAVLRTADPVAKAELSRAVAALWLAGDPTSSETEAAPGSEAPDMIVGRATPPDTPSRPERPELVAPRRAPKRPRGDRMGRAALLHAVAHIELNAIDLHWDIVARFTDTPMPRGFYSDWALAAEQEAKHFLLLSDRLADYDVAYGDLTAHAGLWRSAQATTNDLLARLAIVPMVLEARGLDVTPGMIDLFNSVDDQKTAGVLQVIYTEEVGHVAYGAKWFNFLCGRAELDPKWEFHRLVRKYFPTRLKPPFNDEKRAEAGLPLDFYWPLTDELER